MTSMTLFYELIQVALGNRVVLSRTPTETEWHALYETCQKQSVIGIVFEALDELSKQGQKPPLDLLYQWIADTEQIRQQNLKVNKHKRKFKVQTDEFGVIAWKIQPLFVSLHQN